MFFNLIAMILSLPSVTNWLIRRAMQTPYQHLEKNGEVYMYRFWLFNPYDPDTRRTKWPVPFSIRLHRIMQPDQDRHLHDHPWNARTFILRGHYIEQREDTFLSSRLVLRKAGTSFAIHHTDFHRIERVSVDGVWTLFVTGKYRHVWGFRVGLFFKTPWRKYLGLEDR